jgi:hypothetical protein
MRAAALAFAAGFWSFGAVAAELPSRSATTKPPETKARECFIGGERGFETPGGGCVRISGYVSSQVTAGNVKH